VVISGEYIYVLTINLVNLNQSGNVKNGLPGDVLAAQTALFMIGGQETTVSGLSGY
jgi:cytochrome P450